MTEISPCRIMATSVNVSVGSINFTLATPVEVDSFIIHENYTANVTEVLYAYLYRLLQVTHVFVANNSLDNSSSRKITVLVSGSAELEHFSLSLIVQYCTLTFSLHLTECRGKKE